MSAEERFVFKVEWFDKAAGLARSYILGYYPSDNSLDMVFLLFLPIVRCQK